MADITQIIGSRPVKPVNKVEPEDRKPDEKGDRSKGRKSEQDRPKDDGRHIDEYV